MKIWTGRILLVFAIFTLGFGLGKEVGRRRAAADAETSESAPVDTDKVLVYYLHTSFRCATCNGIEKQARRVVQEDFAQESGAGNVEWRTANFQEREDLATRYGVASSTVVVVDIENGQEKDFKRLDEVWTLHDRQQAFADYVGGAIRHFLEDSE